MKVKLLVSRVGHAYDGKNIDKENPHGRFTGVFSQAPGSIVDMPADEAQRYIDRGFAELPPNDKK